jgi:hypothetical protein
MALNKLRAELECLMHVPTMIDRGECEDLNEQLWCSSQQNFVMYDTVKMGTSNLFNFFIHVRTLYVYREYERRHELFCFRVNLAPEKELCVNHSGGWLTKGVFGL